MGGVVVLGVFVADATFRAARQPRMGETLIGESFSLGPGGKGSNQAVAAARAGARASMITRLGRDPFGDMALRLWEEAGVTPLVAWGDAPTGAASIFVDSATGDNAIIVCPSAAREIRPADLDARAAEIAEADLFVTQFEQPLDAAKRGLEIARAAGVATVLNPAPAAPPPEGMLALCDWVTPNESEAEALTGVAVNSLEAATVAAEKLLTQGAGGVALTMGAEGALLHDGQAAVHIPTFHVGDAIDTVGAGDAFNGAFAAALAEGRDAVEAARFACAAASISVTRTGAAASSPSRAEIDALLTD